ncbi:MAG: hypothetical protein LBU14_00075 [Candidatus Peribacteria bacterium]|jgi:hypothetical protein|nr:hypothetical protein [Candidatus Peribacteria bacterium]
MYLELLNLEANSEETTSTLIQRIMKIHKDIADSVDILVDSCKLAVVMCNQQDPYNEATDCGKCN